LIELNDKSANMWSLRILCGHVEWGLVLRPEFRKSVVIVTLICVQFKHHSYPSGSLIWLTQSVKHETLNHR